MSILETEKPSADDPCPHCRSSGRVSGIDCSVCAAKGTVPKGTKCPCYGCRTEDFARAVNTGEF